ncbi:MAG: hypothetical protein IJ213_09120 [Bacteroidales bacterium]|nr:hypothetical protein [Bacteroidales bacterium]
MDTRKTTLLLLIIAVLTGLSFVSCSDEEEVYNKSKILIGTWVEINSTASDGVVDTIQFTKKGKVYDKTGIHNKSNYKIIDDSHIKFYNMNFYGIKEECYAYSIEQSSNITTITFYNFETLSDILMPIDATYKKIR